MTLTRRALLGASAAAALARLGRAQAKPRIKLGVTTYPDPTATMAASTA